MNFARFKELTRLEQSLFGVPYLFAGALLPFADPSFPFRLAWQWAWIVPAFLFARLSGMAFNQLIDRHIDARNPRTNQRPLPSGSIKVLYARVVAWGCLGGFLLFCSLINPLCFLLGIFAALLIAIYSYMKRVSTATHFVLGMIHLLSPLMAAIAIKETFFIPAFFLGLAAFFSISGNDVLYAFQDYAFDCKEGLYSIPSRLGIKKSLWVAKSCHVMSMLMLVIVGISGHLPAIYFAFLIFVAREFWKFHKLFSAGEKSFFRVNAFTSFLIFFGVFSGILWRALL